MSTTHLIVVAAVKNENKVQFYKEKAGPLLVEFGGQMPPQLYRLTKKLAGSLSPDFMLKVAFPSAAHIERLFESPEYQAIIQNRDEGYRDLSIWIAEA